MVGILIAFLVNNLIWAVLLIYVISLIHNKRMPAILPRKKEEAPVEEYAEATDEQISKHFEKLQRTLKEETGFDLSGAPVEVKEEKAVD